MVTINNKEQLIENGETRLNRKARTLALKSLESALNAVDPAQIMKSKLSLKNSILKVNNHSFDLNNFKNVYVVGGGKASGSMAEALEHILELPSDFLDKVYAKEKYYFAFRNWQKVGVLNFSTTSGRVSNMGVNPPQRGKGYGRNILLFILEQLRRSGCKQANLRVHAKNKPAIHLYESLGFLKEERQVTLIWRK